MHSWGKELEALTRSDVVAVGAVLLVECLESLLSYGRCWWLWGIDVLLLASQCGGVVFSG